VKKKKYILSFDQEINFDLIGLCSHHNDYRLVWNINSQLGIRLVKIDSYNSFQKSGKISTLHSTYEYIDEVNRLTYFLIKNKHEGQYLIPEKTAIDYFLFLCDNTSIRLEKIVQQLKSVPSILGAYEFNPEEISSAKNITLT